MVPDVTAACNYAFERLVSDLSPQMTYHNLAHTRDDVLPNALRLATLANVSDADKMLLQTAAAFHDIGYPMQAAGHEAAGAQIAGDVLPQFQFSAEHITQIQNMILATQLPQSPQTLLEQLLCDADLDILGRPDDFLQRNHDLREEHQTRGGPIGLMAWYEGQRNFLLNHRYHSTVARQSRNEGKKQCIALLDKLLLNLRLASFIPSDLRRSLLNQESSATPRHDSNGYEAVGAALFADIAGFTSLTEKLIGQYGAQRGAEAVLQTVNPLYDAIIPVLYRFNGSVVRFDGDAINCVIGFAGDSITCWLDGVDAAERAVACALAMQQAIADQTVTFADGSTQQIRLKIGIASGKVRRMQVGDPAHGLYDVLAGATVARMALAADAAGSAEIILDPHSASELATRIKTTALPNTYRRLNAYHGNISASPIPPEPAQTIPPALSQPWLLRPVADRLASGGFLAELRPAAALFIRFHGIDFDNDPHAGDKLDRYVRWVQTILNRTRGYLIQLSVGDKGSYLYAAFGAPLAFAANAQRAANAALALRAASQQFPFIDYVEVGLSQGRMWTGAYGSRFRSTYGVISRATNLAARLMTAAQPDQILVHATAASELDSFDLTRQPDIAARGFDEPQGVWALHGAKTLVDHIPTYRSQACELDENGARQRASVGPIGRSRHWQNAFGRHVCTRHAHLWDARCLVAGRPDAARSAV